MVKGILDLLVIPFFGGVGTHVGPGQPDQVLGPTIVLGTVVHHAVHSVEEVVGWGVNPVEGLGSIHLWDGGG